MNSLLYWSTLTACGCLVLAYIWRLKVLNIFTARVDYTLFHACWLLYAGWVFYETLQGRMEIGRLIPLVGSYLWLEISWHTWNEMGGPPRHMLKGKALRELDSKDLHHVAGGKQ